MAIAWCAHQLDQVIECPISAGSRWVCQTRGQESDEGWHIGRYDMNWPAWPRDKLKRKV
jgi:hypothetical protein